jgi:predicted PurR-regulated permease PerM
MLKPRRDDLLPRLQRSEAQRTHSTSLVPWAIGAIAIGALYFGRAVLVPITLAIFLSFLLAPIVAAFRKIRVPRSASVLLAVALALGTIGVTGTVLASQAATLADDAPAYAQRIADKVTNIRASVQRRFGFLMQESREGGSGHRRTERARREGTAALRVPQAGRAIPVEVHQPPPTALEEVKAIALPVLAPIETALIVLVVTIFILLQKEDLRDRVIRLMGARDLHRTTSALDEGAKRLSRYFLAQFTVNCAFGAVIWGGLFLIGIPSPGLWGILAGLLRFVPYVGTVLAAAAPLVLAAAVDPGWHMTIAVAVLFAAVEPFVGYAIEPLLYGRSTGLAPTSVILAAIFWTAVWGPIGLILAMPLTLTLVVLGRHLPAFEFFDILLGDRPALLPTETFYQRVLAGHADEALDHAEDLLEQMPIVDYFDEVALGGLRLAAHDLDRGVVSRETMSTLCETTVDVVASLVDHRDFDPPDLDLSPVPHDTPATLTSQAQQAPASSPPVVGCIAARGPLDRAVAAMLAQLLERSGCSAREFERDGLRPGRLVELDLTGVDVVCITGLFDERAFRRINALKEQLASKWPKVRFLVGVRRGLDENPGAPSSEAPVELHSSLKELSDAASSKGGREAPEEERLPAFDAATQAQDLRAD